MADTSLFSRLRRLFGSDVVIRNIGGDQLKVADINAIQTTGRFETNSLIDRFSRLLYASSKLLIFSVTNNLILSHSFWIFFIIFFLLNLNILFLYSSSSLLFFLQYIFERKPAL